jgi:hypothetical protein
MLNMIQGTINPNKASYFLVGINDINNFIVTGIRKLSILPSLGSGQRFGKTWFLSK